MKHLRNTYLNYLFLWLNIPFIILIFLAEFPFFHNLTDDFNFHNVEHIAHLNGFHNHELFPQKACIDYHTVTSCPIEECIMCFFLTSLNTIRVIYFTHKHYYTHISCLNYFHSIYKKSINFDFNTTRAPPSKHIS